MFIITNKILEGWSVGTGEYKTPEEFRLVTGYGPLGYGKSAFAFKVGIELLQKVYNIDKGKTIMKSDKAWELLKQFIVFHPQQFFDKLTDIENRGLKRIPFLIWDDAGLWLYALEWNDPFLIALGKYLSVARTHLASIFMTTPSPEYIFKKIRQFPQAINISITKMYSSRIDRPSFMWTRRAVPYIQYYNIVRGNRVTRLKYKRRPVEEIFSCRLPGTEADPSTFYGWYKPLRDAYEDIALSMMRTQIDRLKGGMPQLADYPNLRVPSLTL